jgi:hypothetical protein
LNVLVALCLSPLLSPSALAQEPERQFCDDTDPANNCPGPDCLCVDDTLEIVFDGQLENSVFEYPSFTAGMSVPMRVVCGVVTDQIRGYSFGIAHDSAFLDLVRGNLTTAGTASEEAMNGGFTALRLVPGGFILAIVLNFSMPVVLPTGRQVLVAAGYTMTADAGTGGTLIEFTEDLGNPPTQVVLTVDILEFPPIVDKDEMNCTNGVDDDMDGLTDRDDPDCVVRNGVSRVPRTLVDGLVRLEGGGCVPTEPNTELTCTDSMDNDCDGLTDSADPDCAGCVPTEPNTEVTCNDGADNDCDGLTDSADPDCGPPPQCPDYAFYFGPAAATGVFPVTGGSFVISGRNIDPASGFQLGVSATTAGNATTWAFTDQLGGTPQTLVDLVIADNARPLPMSHDPMTPNTASSAAFQVMRGNVVVEQGAAMAAFPAGSDILLVDTVLPGDGVGGTGFTVGYVADGNDDGIDNVIAATTGTCPVNELLTVTLGAAATPFNRGDGDGNGIFNVTDGVIIIQTIIGNIVPQPFQCDDIFDTNDDGILNVADGLPLLTHIFQRGPGLASPFRVCATETPENDTLPCTESNCQ